MVDKDRNAVSLIESIFGNFGSRIVPGDLGFAIQNRGSGFSLEEGHLNSLEPHKRSLHTNMPGFLTKDGQPLMPFGVMGGHMQPQGHVQVLLNMIDFGMNLQEAGDAARIRHGESLYVEPGVSDEVIAELERRGHTVVRPVAVAWVATRRSGSTQRQACCMAGPILGRTAKRSDTRFDLRPLTRPRR